MAVPDAASSAPPAPYPLFAHVPSLAPALARIAFSDYPSPVQRLGSLERHLGTGPLYAKRDDLLGDPFGGGKLRKLELALGAARARGCRAVVTFGGVGSNHALATALYARRAGLRAILMLVPEPPNERVRHRLLAEQALGAELRHYHSLDRAKAAARRLRAGSPGDPPPCVIAAGGSSAVGNAGFVSAAFELKDQIARGALPEPDRIYLAAGTGGSAAGLCLGLAAAGLRSRLMAVQVAPNASLAQIRRQHAELLDALRLLDPSFPDLPFDPGRIELVRGQLGAGYARPTAQGSGAIELFQQHAGLELDDTYTGKALAALLEHAPRLAHEVVLFWNSYDARRPDVGDTRPEDLPADLQGYFR